MLRTNIVTNEYKISYNFILLCMKFLSFRIAWKLITVQQTHP